MSGTQNDRFCQSYRLFLRITCEWMDGLAHWRKTPRSTSNSSTVWVGYVVTAEYRVFHKSVTTSGFHLHCAMSVGPHKRRDTRKRFAPAPAPVPLSSSSNICPQTGYRGWQASWFSSVSADQCRLTLWISPKTMLSTTLQPTIRLTLYAVSLQTLIWPTDSIAK